MQEKFKADKHYQERVVQALIVDHQYAEQMYEVLDPQYFDVDYLQETVKIIFEYYAQYHAFPSLKLIATISKDKIETELLRNQIITYLTRIIKEPLNGDMEYVKETSLDFCKKKVLAAAISTSLDLINEKQYDQITHEIQKALAKGSERDMGHDFLEHFEKRMVVNKRTPIPTGWAEVNKITQGGPASSELWVVCAPTGVGKSHALVDMGVSFIKQGYNVAHYTLELSEIQIGNRYDSRLTEIPVERLVENKDKVKEALDKVKGRVIIKGYPIKGASAMTIKNHLSKLALKSFRPDVLLIDYGDIMRSRKNYDQQRFEQASIYEDLRTLAQELKVPVITATQTNREGLDEDIITLKHVAESFDKCKIADVFLTFNRKQENSPTTYGTFYMAKNRLGPSGVKLPVLATTGISKIEVLSPDAVDMNNVENAADVNRERLRKHFEQMQLEADSKE